MSILVPVWGFERTFVTLEYIFNLVYLRLLYLNLNKILISWAICTNFYYFNNLHQFLLIDQSEPILSFDQFAPILLFDQSAPILLVEQSAQILLIEQSAPILISSAICTNFY